MSDCRKKGKKHHENKNLKKTQFIISKWNILQRYIFCKNKACIKCERSVSYKHGCQWQSINNMIEPSVFWDALFLNSFENLSTTCYIKRIQKQCIPINVWSFSFWQSFRWTFPSIFMCYAHLFQFSKLKGFNLYFLKSWCL